MDFAQCKRQKKLLHHHMRNEQDCPAELRAGVAEEKVATKALDKKRIRAQNELARVTEPRARVLAPGTAIYFAEGVPGDVGRAILEKGYVEVTTRVLADTFVVPDPGSPGVRVVIAAALRGAEVASPTHIFGRRGPVIAYERALGIPRKLYLTDAFREKHPGIANIMCCLASEKKSKWKMFKSSAAFEAAKGACASGGKRSQAIAIATSGEAAKSPKRYVDLLKFIKLIARINRGQSMMGVCGA